MAGVDLADPGDHPVRPVWPPPPRRSATLRYPTPRYGWEAEHVKRIGIRWSVD